MDIITLKLIDRQRRIINKLLTYCVLYPLGLFFIGCFTTGRRYGSYSQPSQTLFEQEFGFDSYWRIIGIIGLIVVFIIYMSLSKIIPFKGGQIELTKDKIKIIQGSRVNEFKVDKLKKFEFLADVTFKSDDRHDFERANVLKFQDNRRNYDYEIFAETNADLDAITPIVKAWKEINSEFKYGYK
jgi:hypothetical protein